LQRISGKGQIPLLPLNALSTPFEAKIYKFVNITDHGEGSDTYFIKS